LQLRILCFFCYNTRKHSLEIQREAARFILLLSQSRALQIPHGSPRRGRETAGITIRIRIGRNENRPTRFVLRQKGE